MNYQSYTEDNLQIEGEKSYKFILENLPDCLACHKLDGCYNYVTPACQSLLGYAPEIIIGQSIKSFCHPEDYHLIEQFYQQLQQQSVINPIVYRMRHQSGHYLWIETSAKVILEPRTGAIEQIICISREITKYKQIEEAFNQAENQYRRIFAHSSQGIFKMTAKGYYLNINTALAQIYGFGSQEEFMQSVIHREKQLYVEPKRRETLLKILDIEQEIVNFESQVYHQDGNVIWISENAWTVCDQSGNFLYYEGTVEDITFLHNTEEKLHRATFFDNLTGLPNRDWFSLQIQEVIALSSLHEYYNFAVLFVDLDSFKVVNDSFGHLVGDKLLVQVAKRLQGSLRTGDKIARFGGDEFAILLENIQSVREAINVAERILARLRSPFNLETGQIFTKASIGITFSDINYQLPEDVLRDGNLAMYRAKTEGKDCYAVFNSNMQLAALNRLQIENDLREAIKQEQLCLYYQPIIELMSGHLSGFEALIRWQHPTKGLIYPDEFIPIAEETGLINPIGWWVIQQACYQLKCWEKEHPKGLKLSINVNLSAQQLKQKGLVEKIGDLLTETKIEGNRLKLEITESCLLETVTIEAQRVNQIKELGIGLCIDDFGTGYSSLSRLYEFPIDTLKIDRSFIRRLEFSQTAIVQIIVSLAHTLGINVVAEGIETLEQLNHLQGLGCELGQGYLFSKPVDSAKANQLLHNYNSEGNRGGFI
ncbi:sensor domain-containing protein [Aphanothece sacrum]|uniref:Diguanylate cyclase n=1 Tax=Aphanothece sacrum FPU1 TaxID=1920663 RepID=A0A401IMG4_APHSA|nr:bifunctional diguanylate cyclase/phosphodiesterase [Aphanothece sacrum]GBF82433.1 diguanylate cyclase [Aphanothece sacrum FPU1]GBF84412.1 diguanylate cyclase [Aphanothece sacrum FPU3]